MRFFFKILIFITFTNIKLGYSQIPSHEKRDECYKNIENRRTSSEESAKKKYYSPIPPEPPGPPCPTCALKAKDCFPEYLCNAHKINDCVFCKECNNFLKKEYSNIKTRYEIERKNCESSYEEERKREEEVARKREEEERKREEEERKREEEKKQSDKEKNSKSKSKRKDSNSSSYVGGYIEDPVRERFNKDKQNAIDEKIKQDIKNHHDIALAAQLSVTSIGFYLYNPPKQRYYNTRGRFFSLGPQNSFLNIPIVSIKKSFREELINYNYSYLPIPMYSKKEITIEPLADKVAVPTIGAGMSFGYIGDNINFSLPINGSFGLFNMSQMSLNYGYGFNLFVGSPNFKIGIGTDFNYYSLTKNDFNATDYQHAYTTSRISFDSEASLLIKKLGIRFQKNMNSNSTNLELPKIVDFYLLFSNTNINNSSNLFDCSLDTKDYGFEIVYNIYGKIGFTFKYLRMDPIDKINEPFDLFNKSSYFQIGVKKDYTWFKSY